MASAGASSVYVQTIFGCEAMLRVESRFAARVASLVEERIMVLRGNKIWGVRASEVIGKRVLGGRKSDNSRRVCMPVDDDGKSLPALVV